MPILGLQKWKSSTQATRYLRSDIFGILLTKTIRAHFIHAKLYFIWLLSAYEEVIVQLFRLCNW